jgi:hypothetical protein
MYFVVSTLPMRKFITILLFALCGITAINAQKKLPEFGEFLYDDIALTRCPFDTNANAVIIFEEGFSNYDGDYNLVTQKRVRIKILNQRGADHGTIVIPFYSKDNFESIRNIEGISFNPGDREEKVLLNRKSVFTEKVNDKYSNIKFAMPNVKEGTLLEYKYESVMKHYGGLENWIFQSDIPTMRSSYLLQIPPNVEFSYVLATKPEYKVTVIPKSDIGQIYYEMNNLPGLRFEPFMDAPGDYLQKVEFQLSSYITQYGTKKKINTSWEEIAKSLSADEALGGTARKKLSIPADLKLEADKQSTTEGKINVIYSYVNRNFSSNGYDSKYATEPLKKIVEKKTGTSGEINLILLNYLQSFNIESYPMLAAEKDYGKVDVRFALIDRFNKTVVYAIDGEKDFILDASVNYLPSTMTPELLINTLALVIDKKNHKLLRLNHGDQTYNSTINVKGALESSGMLSGQADISSIEYAKQSEISRIRSDEGKYIHESFEEDYEGIKATRFSYDYSPDPAKPLTQTLSFTQDLNDNGGFILLNINLFTGLSKNPFTSDQRFTNVNFGYPYNITVNSTIDLPAGAKVDDIPKDKTLTTPEKDISISRKISLEGNQLKIKIQFMQNTTLVETNLYKQLQRFYKEMTEMLNQPVVIKVK